MIPSAWDELPINLMHETSKLSSLNMSLVPRKNFLRSIRTKISKSKLMSNILAVLLPRMVLDTS